MTNQVISLINDIIKKKGIPKYSNNWKVMDAEKEFKTTDSCFLYIIKNLKIYHKHSNLICISDYKNLEKIEDNRKMPKFYWDKNKKIGRIIFYHFFTTLNKNSNINDENNMIKITRQILKEWLQKKIKGLIIDLRFHKGGNFYPFILALSDILNNTSLFCIKKDNKDIWFNMEDRITIGSFLNNKLDFEKPIAIIIGEKTKSSGEFSAAIFKDRENVKFFGKKTGGFLSMNSTITINQKLKLLLPTDLIITVGNNLAESEQIYPDIITNRPVSDAKIWINEN